MANLLEPTHPPDEFKKLLMKYGMAVDKRKNKRLLLYIANEKHSS